MLTLERYSLLQGLQCSKCKQQYNSQKISNFSTCCNKPLTADYDLDVGFSKADIDQHDNTMWRYHAMLPIFNKQNIISLGEGMTPVLQLHSLGKKYFFPRVFNCSTGVIPSPRLIIFCLCNTGSML